MRAWKQVRQDGIRLRAAKRLSRLSTPEILDWADQVGTGIARALMDYRKGDQAALAEARDAVSALQGVLDTLEERH